MPERGREDVEDEDKEDRRCCQGKLCGSLKTPKNVAVKICHHEDCQEVNNGHPLVLCLKCDEAQHLGVTTAHARFDLPERQRGSLIKLPKQPAGSDNDSGNEDDVDSRLDKKTTRGYSSGKRLFKLSAGNKKKPRRHNTEDPTRSCFSVRFHDNNTPGVEVMPALKGKSLKESLESLFEKRTLSFATHSVFLDSSNTPLPLAFDTFPLGGNVLHVRANADVSIDQRVMDVSSQVKPSEEPPSRPRGPSFMSRSGSFTSKKQGIPEKEKDSKEKAEKMTQQLKSSQRGKKNIISLLGDDPAMPTSMSSPVLPGGVVMSSTGTLHRPKSASKLTGLFIQPKQAKEDILRSIPLKDLLDMYTVYGLDYNGSSEQTENDVDEDITLENSWTDVVDASIIEGMTKKERDQQEAIWELLSTEVSYIEKLRVLIKVYILCLKKLQMEGYLQDIEISKLFSNVEDIYEVNLSFWLDCLSQVAEASRNTREPLNPSAMSEGFPMFDIRFEPYIRYCMEEANCLKYLKEKLLESDEFRQYITWCEEHRLCTDRLKLNDLLVKPMQRVTKYGLLLKAVLNKTQNLDEEEQIKRMMSKVESFVSKVDGSMKKLHDQEKLIAVAERITNNYNVVEAVNEEMERLLQDYSALNLTGPMPGLGSFRCVVHEGPLRLLEKQGKTDVYVFLFTDLLLITKAKKGDKCRVIKPPIQVEKLAVHKSKDPGTFLLISLNDYNTVVYAFALQGSVTDENQWLDSIREAQKRYAVEKMSQGSGNLFQTGDENFSPTTFIGSPFGASSGDLRAQRRASSASSILSMDSDSEDESTPYEQQPNRLPRSRSESILTSASSGAHSWEKEKEQEPIGSKYEVPDERPNSRDDKSVGTIDPDELLGAVGGVRLRLDSGKVSRSSSAPQHERPRVESALSRSSSDPLGPSHRREIRGVVIKRRTLEEDVSYTSSSISLEESESSLQTSVEFPSLPLRETQSLSSEVDLGSPQTPVVDSPPGYSDAFEPDRRGSSPSHSDPSSPCELDGVASVEDGNDSETSQSSQEAVRSPSSKQTPRIKSPLIAQQKLNSAIYTAESNQRKRAGLPRRSSPVMSRRPKPDDLMRSRNDTGEDKSTKEQEIVEIMEKIRDGTRSLPPKLGSRNSEPKMAPIKPDRSLYPEADDVSHNDDGSRNDSVSRNDGVSRNNGVSRSDEISGSGERREVRRTMPLRKKSMSLSDLLNLGRELTGGRSEKTKGKERNRENEEEEYPDAGPHANDTGAQECEKKNRKKSKEEPEDKRRRFKIRRRKSQCMDLKDGIASGPNIDKRKATKLFLKESLMLESSKPKLITSNDHKAKYIFDLTNG